MGTSNQGITFKGNPISVSGTELRVGDKIPDFTLTGTDLQDIGLSAFSGKVLVIACAPSLDTPVCSTQTKQFNEKAASLSGDIVVLTVSRDLPFAQKRWCGAEGVEGAVCASDYKHRSFGPQFGCVWEDAGLLCRAVFVVDKEGVIQHVEYAAEIAEEPDYHAALAKAKELV